MIKRIIDYLNYHLIKASLTSLFIKIILHILLILSIQLLLFGLPIVYAEGSFLANWIFVQESDDGEKYVVYVGDRFHRIAQDPSPATLPSNSNVNKTPLLNFKSYTVIPPTKNIQGFNAVLEAKMRIENDLIPLASAKKLTTKAFIVGVFETFPSFTSNHPLVRVSESNNVREAFIKQLYTYAFCHQNIPNLKENVAHYVTVYELSVATKTIFPYLSDQQIREYILNVPQHHYFETVKRVNQDMLSYFQKLSAKLNQ